MGPPDRFRLIFLLNDEESVAIELLGIRYVLQIFMKYAGATVCKFSRQPFDDIENLGQPGGCSIVGQMALNTSHFEIKVMEDSHPTSFDFHPKIIQNMILIRASDKQVQVNPVSGTSAADSMKRSKSSKRAEKRKLKKLNEISMLQEKNDITILDSQSLSNAIDSGSEKKKNVAPNLTAEALTKIGFEHAEEFTST